MTDPPSTDEQLEQTPFSIDHYVTMLNLLVNFYVDLQEREAQRTETSWPDTSDIYRGLIDTLDAHYRQMSYPEAALRETLQQQLIAAYEEIILDLWDTMRLADIELLKPRTVEMAQKLTQEKLAREDEKHP